MHVVAFNPATRELVAELFPQPGRGLRDRRPVSRLLHPSRRAARRCGSGGVLLGSDRRRRQGRLWRSDCRGASRGIVGDDRDSRDTQMIARSVVLASLMLAAAATAVRAQTPEPSLKRHEIVIGGGPILAGGYDLGDSLAQLRTNAPGAQPPPFTLFAVSSTMEPLAGVEAQCRLCDHAVACRRGRWLVCAGEHRSGACLATRRLRQSRLTERSCSSSFSRVVSRGSCPGRLDARRHPSSPRARAICVSSTKSARWSKAAAVFYAGGGVRYFIRGGAERPVRIGVRGDVRATWRTPGIDFEDKTRMFPTLTVMVFVGL